ncbi:Leucine-rich repeat, typical subtype [Niveomyces insectorum RCEF 264]|uniref:Leucine-rich repeat, typical subtype n=1 Tax=Niveomyces insectorum RCEF 264 TaxID=1081102 RepID=A0A167RBU9_9HYPO|nr:Leucine-rich repeat, typical subtype [Niveomyces insectorum RCEF 264]
MDDRRQSFRPSGLPRLSRLPVNSSTSTSTPTPTLTTGTSTAASRPTSASNAAPLASSATNRPLAVRPRPSRESISGGELRNPKLRAVPSRDRLGPHATAPAVTPSSASSGASLSLPKAPLRHPSPRTRAVSGQYAKAPTRPPGSTTVPPPPSVISRATDNTSTAAAGSRRPGAGPLMRRTSKQQLAQHVPSSSVSRSISPDDGPADSDRNYSENENQDDMEGYMARDSLRPRLPRSRPSLADRTIETLSQIPSSPAVKGRSSAFFDPDGTRSFHARPNSRTGGNGSGSRPGSSYQSDNGSVRSLSRPPSRPPSGSSRDEPAHNTRPGTASFRSAVPPSFASSDAMPTPGRASHARTLRGRASIGPGVIGGQRSGGLNSSFLPARSRTPSPEKKPTLSLVAHHPPPSSRVATTPGKFASKTVTVRPVKSRPSLNGLFRKPSMSNIDSSVPVAASPAATRKSSLTSRASSTSYEETTPSRASTVSTALSIDSAEGLGQGAASTSRKSSAALREQIAKAKAAKRALATQNAAEKAPSPAGATSSVLAPVPPSAPSSVGDAAETPVIPTDTTFDFGLAADPFSQNRGNSQSQSKVIKARAAAARTSGRLNIAAMNLREIPSEVMKMYDPESMDVYDGSWAESVDLTRFVAADNEIEMIEDAIFPDLSPEELAEDEDGRGNIFGGLETLDLHGNMLISLPIGLRRLQLLTSLNLVRLLCFSFRGLRVGSGEVLMSLKSQNRITNNALDVISQITSLRDLKLGGNLFYGPLDASFAKLDNLEIADLHGNNISTLPPDISNMAKLRILNISENNFESVSFEPLSKLPLVELHARKNKLSGVLVEDAVSTLPNLQILDVSSNQLTHIVSTSRSDNLILPALQQLLISMNRLQTMPDIGSWTSLLTLAADENSINSIPDGFPKLATLRHADFSSNDIRIIPSEIGRMDNLAMLRLGGNPLRDKKFCTATTEEIKDTLLTRLEPEPEPEPEPQFGQEPAADAILVHGLTTSELKDELRDAVTELSTKVGSHGRQRSRKLSSASAGGRDDDYRSDDDYATPPTSLPHTPARSRSHTLSNQLWPVKAGGVLDRSETDSASLHPVISARVAQEHAIREIHLQRNLFTVLPDALSFFAETLTVLSLAKNQLTGEAYLGDAAVSDGLDLPALKELNLAANHITGLTPLVRHLRAPALQKLDVGLNRITALPADTQLRTAFPDLTVLLASNNHLADLDPASIKGLRVVDVSNNDIEHLNPRIGLLGGVGGLERLDVLGNRFRVPRFNVIERGTEATLRWLRGRVPVAEMGAWREANQRNGVDMDDDID